MTVCTPKTGVIDLSTRGPASRPSAIAIAIEVGGVAVLGAGCIVVTAARLDRHALIVAAFLCASVVLGRAAMVDARQHRLPNRLLLAALVVLGVAPLLAWQLGALLAAALGLLLGGLPILVALLTRATGAGVGVGDVKFAAVLGAAAGLVHPLAALATVFLGALGSSTYAAVRRIRRLPLGPWLWGGFALSTVLASFVLEGLEGLEGGI